MNEVNVLLAHGSSNSLHKESARTLASKVSHILDAEVQVAFLGDAKLPIAARVLPLFLGGGKHTCVDIPDLMTKYGGKLLPALASNTITDMAYDLVISRRKQADVLFVTYQISGFEALIASLNQKWKYDADMHIAALHGEPSVEATLHHWQAKGASSTIIIQPLLLFAGHSFDRLRRVIKSMKMQTIHISVPLAEHSDFPLLLADCFRAMK
ncbi:MAG: hypothetical protein R8M38_05770 [Mariprofundaceae bacterium]